MKRLALGTALLAAAYLGTLLTAWIGVRASAPWFLNDAVYFAPTAALLAWLVHDRVWALLVVLDLCVLSVVEHLLIPVLRAGLQPRLGTFYPLPIQLDQFPIWAAYFLIVGVVVGLVEVAVLWPFLRPAWMWPVFKIGAYAATALALLWRVSLPLLGARGGWDWASALIGAVGIALLWRFGARAPRLNWPPFRLPPQVKDEVDPAYAARMNDLENSLEA